MVGDELLVYGDAPVGVFLVVTYGDVALSQVSHRVIFIFEDDDVGAGGDNELVLP